MVTVTPPDIQMLQTGKVNSCFRHATTSGNQKPEVIFMRLKHLTEIWLFYTCFYQIFLA